MSRGVVQIEHFEARSSFTSTYLSESLGEWRSRATHGTADTAASPSGFRRESNANNNEDRARERRAFRGALTITHDTTVRRELEAK